MSSRQLHRCSACARPVIVLDGQVIRACRCDAPVIGEMRAHVVAVSSLGVAAVPRAED